MGRGVRTAVAGDPILTAETVRAALDEAHAHDGLSLVHVPVYCGDDPIGGMGREGGTLGVHDYLEPKYVKTKLSG